VVIDEVQDFTIAQLALILAHAEKIRRISCCAATPIRSSHPTNFFLLGGGARAVLARGRRRRTSHRARWAVLRAQIYRQHEGG